MQIEYSYRPTVGWLHTDVAYHIEFIANASFQVMYLVRPLYSYRL